MDLITDHHILIKKFVDTQNELDEFERNYRVVHPFVGRYDSKLYIPSENDPRILSFKYVPPKRFAYKRQPKLIKLKYSSESSEESYYEDELQRKKVCLKSAVIARGGNSESRRDVINKQNINQKVQTRNCRIFGMLQSTLQKFQDDAVKRQCQDIKRKKLEQKVEAAYEEENWRIKEEERKLHRKMEDKKLQLHCLKEMMMITESFEAWKCNKKNLLHFIITKAEPQICYLPASHTPSSEKQLKKTRIEVQESIQNQEAAVRMELAKIKDSYQEVDLTTTGKFSTSQDR